MPTLPPAVPNTLLRYDAAGELETASLSQVLDAISSPTPPASPAVGDKWADTSNVAQEPTGKSFRVEQVALGLGTGTQDVQWAADANWTDLHRPKLIVSLGGRITANAAVTHGFSQSLGFMAAAMERAAWWGSPDNVATAVPRSRLRSAGLSLYSPGSTPTADGEVSLAALLPNGYRITRDVAPGGAYLANTLVLGGASVRVAMGEALMPTAIGAQVYATGFQPTAVLVMAVLDDGSTADAASATNAVRRCLGFASGVTAGAQGVVATMLRNSVAADALNAAGRWGQTGRVASVIDWDGATGTELVKGVLSAWDASGFTIDWQTVNATARRFVWIALAGVSAKAGFVTTANPSGDVAVSGLGFAPKAGIFASVRHGDAQGANPAGADNLSLALAGPDLAQFVMAQNTAATGGVTSTDYAQLQTSGRVYTNVARTAANTFSINRQTGLKSWDADGFTVTSYENDGVPVFYLVLG
jgi:hypothetical protein